MRRQGLLGSWGPAAPTVGGHENARASAGKALCSCHEAGCHPDWRDATRRQVRPRGPEPSPVFGEGQGGHLAQDAGPHQAGWHTAAPITAAAPCAPRPCRRGGGSQLPRAPRVRTPAAPDTCLLPFRRCAWPAVWARSEQVAPDRGQANICRPGACGRAPGRGLAPRLSGPHAWGLEAQPLTPVAGRCAEAPTRLPAGQWP